MSDTTATLTGPADAEAPHIRRRRHASQSARPANGWAPRARVAGGVLGTTLALTGIAASGSADAATANDQSSTGTFPTLSTAETSAEALQALDQTAVDLQIDAQRDEAAAAAQKAARTKAAEAARKAAAKKAADARAAAEASASRSSDRTSLDLNVSVGSGSVASVISFLKAQVGKPYVYGATGPTAYDCSGLTRAAFATVGVDLPRTSQDQSTVGTPVSVSDVQPGDLVFWGGTGSAYHVAVYIGGGEYLDAANPSKGVVIQKMSYYMPTSAMRVL